MRRYAVSLVALLLVVEPARAADTPAAPAPAGAGVDDKAAPAAPPGAVIAPPVTTAVPRVLPPGVETNPLNAEPGSRAVPAPLLQELPAGVVAAPPPRLTWSPGIRYDYWHENVASYRIDDVGTRSGFDNIGRHRLRVSPRIAWDAFEVGAETDFFTGQLYGDQEDVAAASRRFGRRDAYNGRRAIDFRALYFKWTTPYGVLTVGQQFNRWGLGLIANDGQPERERFGAKLHGNRVERLFFLTKPLKRVLPGNGFGEHFYVGAGFDVTYWDPNADLVRGDRALGATVVLGVDYDNYRNGVFFAYRNQRDRNGDRLEAYAVSLAGKNRRTFTVNTGCTPTAGPRGLPNPYCADGAFRFTPFLNYELVAINGTTNRVRLTTAPDGVTIQQFGAVVQTGIDFPSWGVEPSLELGYMSGDRNSFDKKARQFFGDPDFNVGLILFDEVLMMQSARAVARLSDPELSGRPQKGIAQTNTLGRVTNTLYLLPMVKFRPTPQLLVMAGALFAWSAARNGSAYETFLNGGVATNAFGRTMTAATAFYGTEALFAVQYDMPIAHLAFPEETAGFVRGEFAAFVPGGAFLAPDGTPMPAIHKILLNAGVRWR